MVDSIAPDTRLLTAKAVRDRTSLSKTTIWRLCAKGEFPRPIRLTAGRVAWDRQAVENFITLRKEAA